jgi:polygalacturonase
LVDIREYGAVGDGVTKNTAAIQAAIDACSARRAAGVLVAGGSYVTGTIYLKSFVTLVVAPGAELLGSTDIRDYTTDTHANQYRGEAHMDRCLIFARGAERIGIEGGGVIDGRGGKQNFPNPGDAEKHRPMLIRLLECSSIRMRNVTLRNPASWTSAWLYCRGIVVDGITIHSRANGNGDGLDFDGCDGVRVSNSHFDTSDDSICLQTSRPDRPCRDVTITNCIFASYHAGMRIGLLSRGDFENVAVTNCIFRDIRDAGLKIQMCEGGEMRNMLFTNLVMTNVPRPIFLTFGQQRAAKDAPPEVAPMKRVRGLTFSHLQVDNSMVGKDSAIILVGMPGHPLENITLADIQFLSGGGGEDSPDSSLLLPDLTVERLAGRWPEYTAFKRTVPAHGIYAGHVSGLTIHNVALRVAQPDRRPAIVCDDVRNLDLFGVEVNATASAAPLVFLHDAPDANVDRVRSTGAVREPLRRQ